jgi:hypothetical protein
MRKLSILSVAFMSLLVFSAPAFAASDKGGVKAQPCSKKAKKSKLKRCKVQLPATKPVSTTKPPKPSTKPFPVVSESASEVKLPKPSTEPLPVVSESASEVKLPKPSTEPLPIVEPVIESKPINCLGTNCPPLVDKPIHCLRVGGCADQPIEEFVQGGKCAVGSTDGAVNALQGVVKPPKGSGAVEQALPIEGAKQGGKTCSVEMPATPVTSLPAKTCTTSKCFSFGTVKTLAAQ